MKLVDDLKQKLPGICEKYDIAFVDLFGSLAREDDSLESDIDLIIDFQEPRNHEISKRFFGFLHTIEDRYGRKVDILTPSSLTNPYLVKEINKDRIRIYEHQN